MFVINYHKFIKNNFSFLKEFGFVCTKLQNGPDLELIFSREDTAVEILYYYGVDDKYNKGYYIDVVVCKNGIRENLLNCTKVFGEEKIIELAMEVSSAKLKNEIIAYARFISNNISMLLD